MDATWPAAEANDPLIVPALGSSVFYADVDVDELLKRVGNAFLEINDVDVEGDEEAGGEAAAGGEAKEGGAEAKEGGDKVDGPPPLPTMFAMQAARADDTTADTTADAVAGEEGKEGKEGKEAASEYKVQVNAVAHCPYCVQALLTSRGRAPLKLIAQIYAPAAGEKRFVSAVTFEGVAAAETLVMPVVAKVEEELIDLLAASA